MTRARIIGGLIGSLCLAPQVGSAQSSTCKSSDAFSNHVIASLKMLMSPSHSDERSAIGLPQVNASDIVLVSDANVCTQARLAMDSLGHAWVPTAPAAPPDSRALYVVHVGSTYCVFNPYVASRNHYEFLFYFASNWQFLSMRAL
jgi:hypothetical protein